ncbi:hypothetical protein M3Y97_00193800 [Aphelenchoides bicaudatus]|nr:hypothetical protein M3Y97_00193800 [Aphelenchoides bicaudatus]
MDSLDVVEEIVDCQPSLETMFATDSGPVRQSLLNLVLQDDIPDLLMAMSEDLHFVFEDCSPMESVTHGIILNGSKRRANGQKQARTQNRICFADSFPSVFTYLDESAALEEGLWRAGRPITYEEYLKLVGDTQDQTAKQAAELSKWRCAMMQSKVSDQNDNALRDATSQLAKISLHPPLSPNSSRTPSPDEIERITALARYPYVSTSASRLVAPRECGTSAI